MHKTLRLAVTLLLLSATAVQAQTLHYGAKTELNLSTVSGKGLRESLTAGFTAGAFAELDFSKKWGLQPELLFNLLNTKRGDDFMTYYVSAGNRDGSDKIRLGYISLPVLLRYNINDIVTINAGPQYSYLVGADENIVRSSWNAFSKHNLGAALGLTLNVAQVRFYGRYVLGLSDVNDIDDRYSWRTHQVQIGLGIAIK